MIKLKDILIKENEDNTAGLPVIRKDVGNNYNARPNSKVIEETLQYNQIPASMMKDFLPVGSMTYTTPEEKKKALQLYKDLKNTINKFWKDHKINRKIK